MGWFGICSHNQSTTTKHTKVNIEQKNPTLQDLLFKLFPVSLLQDVTKIHTLLNLIVVFFFFFKWLMIWAAVWINNEAKCERSERGIRVIRRKHRSASTCHGAQQTQCKVRAKWEKLVWVKFVWQRGRLAGSVTGSPSSLMSLRS